MAFEVEDELEGTHGINITPLVDVCLTLVIIFMVIMPTSVIHSIQVRKQALEKYGLSTPQENIRIHLSTRGIYIKNENGKSVKVPYKSFGMILSQMLQVSSTGRVMLSADRKVPHGQAVWVLDLAKQNGAADLTLVEGK